MRRVINDFRVFRNRDDGAILVFATLSLFILMGMAAFAVDYGWIAWNRLEARKAAEAAALAGVVHMPLSGSATLTPGEAAYDTALDVASQAGFDNSDANVIVRPEETFSANQLKVSVQTTVDTFFLRVFRPSPITVAQSATAEQLPPLKLGSDEAQLGGPGTELWTAINGERRKKNSGDPFSTRCASNNGEESRCSGTSNSEFRDPAYYYAVEVPEGQTGNLRVHVYDGTHRDRGSIDVETGEYNTDQDDWRLRFRLYPPDNTPNDWTDNSSKSTHVCGRNFFRDGDQPQGVGWGVNEWRSIGNCGTATAGIYVLEVSVDGSDSSVSAFALRARVGGTTNVAVYGLGAMSLWMNEDDSNPTFKIVRLDQIYAGTELQLGLFDPGDATGLSRMEFTGALAGIDCEVRVRDNFGGSSGWFSDGYWNSTKGDAAGDWAGSSCGITTATNSTSRLYNGDWLDLRFKVPAGYTCTGTACWAYVDYDFTNSPFDRTTWTATINGTPIHLEP